MKSVFRAVLALSLLFGTVLVGAAPAMAVAVGGTVTGGGGQLNQVLIQAYEASGGNVPVDSDVTDASGVYALDLPDGEYKLRATYQGSNGDWVGQWWNGKQTRATADILTVPSQTTANFTLTEGGRISGTVEDANGPLDMCIGIFEIVDGNLRVKGSARSNNPVGQYTARNIAKGATVVRATHCAGDPIVYGTIWYDDKPTGFTADNVQVSATPRTGIDFLMSQDFTIAGQVTEVNTSNAATGACVKAYKGDNNTASGTDNVESSGDYAIEGLSNGVYRVKVADCRDGQARWKTIWYEDATSRSGSDPIDTADPVGLGYNVVATPIGDIKGKVTKQSGGGSLSGVKVRAYLGNSVVKSIKTSGNGNYTLDDIQAGTYDIKFTKSGYTTEWYKGVTARVSATDVTVSRGEVEKNINASMQKPDDDDGGGGGGGGGDKGSIAGTVTGITGSAVSGAKVEVYKTSGSLVKSATTSSTGAYKVSGLDDGTYLVLFASGSASYFADWYTSAPLYREADATKVTVNGAETGKNGNLQPIFSDIGGSTFYGDILWLRNTGITLGCDDFHFCPSSSVTRGQMAAFLVRGLDLTGDTSGDTFTDDNGSTFEDEIEILAQAGVTLGCADGLFCPDASVTRGQMAAFLVRAMNYDYNPPGDRFIDDNGSTFEDEIEKLAEAGVTQGCTDTQFCPNDPVTRGQMAAFLHRALGGGIIYPG